MSKVPRPSRKALLVGVFLVAVLSVRCATLQQVAETAISKTAEKTGEAVGERIAQAIVRHYTPKFMSLYVSYMFTYAFGSNGYWVEGKPYKAGEWTKWVEITTGDIEGSSFVKAFLKKTEEGNEWWKVKFYDAASGDTIILEGLFSQDREELLRLRGKFPNQQAGEMPMEKGVYVQPLQLTKESIEGATIGTKQIDVRAGSFAAQHVRYADVTTNTTIEIFLTDQVPGGAVKYLYTSTAEYQESDQVEGMDKSKYSMELQSYGAGAKSELNSF